MNTTLILLTILAEIWGLWIPTFGVTTKPVLVRTNIARLGTKQWVLNVELIHKPPELGLQ